MGADLTPDLIDISLAETAGSGTWAGTSGQFDAQVFVQGAESWTYQTPKNGIGDGNFTPASAVNLSGTDGHLYWWMRCDVMPFCELLNTGATSSGLTVKIESSATDYIQWHVAGRDTWQGEFRAFVLDVNNTADIYLSSGTLNLAAVTKISWLTDNSNSGTIRIIDNTWIDAVRFGTGLVVTGTDFNLVDIAAQDASIGNRFGILENIDGVIFSQGRITIGNDASTATFNSTDEVLVFRESFVSTDLYQLNLVGSSNTSTINGLVCKAAGSTDTHRYYTNFSDASISATISGSTFIRSGLIDLNTTTDIQTSVFNDCLQIDSSGSIFQNNTISNYLGSEGGALLVNNSGIDNVTDIKFISATQIDTSTHAIYVTDPSEYTFTNFTYSGYASVDGSTGGENVYNNSSGHVIVNLSGGDFPTIHDAIDASTDVVNTITLTMTVTDEAGSPIEGANAYIDDDNQLPYIMSTTTNASGIATVAHGGGSVLGSTWRVRLYGYKPFKSIIDIGASNISVPVTLIVDPQQT